MTVHRIIRTRLHRYPYKIQMLHGLKDSDKPKRKAWAMHMLDGVYQDIDFLNLFVFSDECTFFVSGHVNTHNNRYWSTENPHELVEQHRGTGKVNVWCALAHDQVVAIHFINEATVCGGNYLEIWSSMRYHSLLMGELTGW